MNDFPLWQPKPHRENVGPLIRPYLGLLCQVALKLVKGNQGFATELVLATISGIAASPPPAGGIKCELLTELRHQYLRRFQVCWN